MMYAAATQIKSIVELYRLDSGFGWTYSTFNSRDIEPSGTPEPKSVAKPTRNGRYPR